MIFSQSATVLAIGFSRKTCLPACERRDRRLGVLVPHGDDRDGVDIRVGEQLAVVGIGLLHAELLGERGETAFGARAERGKLEIGDADDGVAMDLAEPAEPDDADPQPVQSVLRQKSSSVISRAMTILPAVSPQSTGSTTPVIADAASEARKATARGDVDRLDDAAERIPALQLGQDLGVAAPRAAPRSASARFPDRRIRPDAVAAVLDAPATG